MHLCIYVHVIFVYVHVYSCIISGTQKTENEVLFEILFFVPSKHTFGNKELHWSDIGSCIIKHSAVKETQICYQPK